MTYQPLDATESATGRRLSDEEIRRGASYLTFALGVFVHPEDYAASVQHGISGEGFGAACARAARLPLDSRKPGGLPVSPTHNGHTDSE